MLSENVPASLKIAETRWPGEQRKTSIQFAGSSVPYVASCPLYPRKQTCAVRQCMSALGQKRTWTEPWAITELAPVVKPGRYAGKISTGLVAH
jgi:hypothetical protein